MTPDEDALLFLYVFSLTLRAVLEDARNARNDRACLTSGFALAPYSISAPLQRRDLERAQPRGKLWGVACAFRRER